jgi:hypothetical protein
MDKADVNQIADFLVEVREDLCEGEGETAMRLHLTELYRVIQRLMDATFATQDQELKVLLASLEYETRPRKQKIERRLGLRN